MFYTDLFSELIHDFGGDCALIATEFLFQASSARLSGQALNVPTAPYNLYRLVFGIKKTMKNSSVVIMKLD